MSGRPRKQACRDELVVYVFFSSVYISLYFYVLSTVLRKSSFTLYIYIYIYIRKKKTHKLQVHPYKPVSCIVVSVSRFEVVLCESDVCFGCVVVFT